MNKVLCQCQLWPTNIWKFSNTVQNVKINSINIYYGRHGFVFHRKISFYDNYGLLLTNVILDCNCYLDLKIRQFEAKRLNNPCPDFV